MSDDGPGIEGLRIEGAGDIPSGTRFEDAVRELERCVDRLESGDAGLDEALQLFRRGTALQAWCEGRLEEIRVQVEELTGGGDAPGGARS